MIEQTRFIVLLFSADARFLFFFLKNTMRYQEIPIVRWMPNIKNRWAR